MSCNVEKEERAIKSRKKGKETVDKMPWYNFLWESVAEGSTVKKENKIF